MSKLRQKSDFNISAADALLQKNLYAPSVHCSYYSCFQLLKYTIKEFFGEDYEAQAVNIAASQQKTHQHVVNYVSNELKGLAGIEESRKFKRTIKDLKQFRTESDYENVEVNSDKGNNAYTKANEIRSYIIKNFKV
ncbi:HEPN domain-containing protein [Saccharicrinis carchari]|uniref:HEPN domain-containing protein n=1 Tax=Saccharicrinis carchari TaxID=1168039 RepID=A0A521E2V0_SACCC|nr:HEPN domain-containing protein [Saccharicrinis carchari]SMO77661.1 HEPN domain-containing protein [Saccharicrinis carchari]